MTDEPKLYEIAFIAKDENGAATVLQTIARHKGEVVQEGKVERITLAYPIDKHKEAHFGYVHAKIAPMETPLLIAELERESGIIRSLVITPPPEKPKPRMNPKERMMRKGEDAPIPPVSAEPLSNEALEKKIEEILQQ